jgi:preprotein translocase subunit SecA
MTNSMVSTHNITHNLGIEDLILGVSSLETTEIELFMQKLGQLVARRKTPSASERETLLLMAINQAIPQKVQERYTLMVEKLENETMTHTENKAFLKLVDRMEALQANRLQYLLELSQLRGVSLETVMNQLHLNTLNAQS